YLNVNLFACQGIAVQWQAFQHPVYPQQHGEFLSHLSALDLLLNCGEESPAILSRCLEQEAL
ncbi:MAG: WbqC family protein, partial [Flavobacteriaceae bacterium]